MASISDRLFKILNPQMSSASDPRRRPVLVTGVSGQVGSMLAGLLGARAVAPSESEFDLTRTDRIEAYLNQLNPVAILNPAAFTAVDLAEKERELAHKINVEAQGALARWAAGKGIPLLTYSTDYVFPGNGSSPWREDDPTGPLNAYGESKLAGEKQVIAAGGKYLILRTSWVYDCCRKNFFTAMLKLGQERDQLTIVNDQFGAPTYAPQLAEASLQALERALSMPEFPSGIYHLCNGGVTSWFEFAQAIFARLRGAGVSLRVKTVEPIPTSRYPSPARRPLNSRLDMSKIQRVLGVRMPDWAEGLDACIREHSRRDSQEKTKL